MPGTKTAASNARQYWALADQYLAEAIDPNASPEQAACARSLYDEAIEAAERCELAKREAATRRHARIRILRDLIARASTPEGEKAAAQRLLDKLEQSADFETRAYGAKYDHTGAMTVTDIAAQIRAEIKLTRRLAAETAHVPAGPGEIVVSDPVGTMPEQIKVSVSSKRYSGGQSITIALTAIPEAWGFAPAAEPTEYRVHDSSPALRTVSAALMRVLESYNHNGSDLVSGYSDRRFYGFVDYRLPEDAR